MKIWILAIGGDSGAIMSELTITPYFSKEDAEAAIIAELKEYMQCSGLKPMPDPECKDVDAWRAHIEAELEESFDSELDWIWQIEEHDVVDPSPAVLEVM